MIQVSERKISDLLLFFFILLFSNITAFIGVIWQIPSIVLVDTILLGVTALICIYKITKNRLLPRLRKSLIRNWFIFPFIAFSGISIIWSVFAEISIYRWLTLIFTVIVAGYIVLNYDFEFILKSLTSFGVWILLLSLFLVIFKPNIGVMNYLNIQGAWKGLFWHKNHMGLIASFINILFLLNAIKSLNSQGRSKYLWILLYLFSLYFIYETDSVAAYLTTIVISGTIFLLLVWLKIRERLITQHYIILFITIAIISLILVLNLDRVFNLFNRNTSLTGRIPMWTNLFNIYISKQPLFGYGFNAFWFIDTHRVVVQQATGYADPIVISDNGFIDILVNTGFIGLFLFFIFYVGVWWRSIQHAGRALSINGFFPLILMAFTLIANISWSLIFENESFFMLLMMLFLFYVSKDNKELVLET